ncbi:MAG: PAS domain-containing protein [Herminiimonas sp.]|nr:PAS domain-containing protein [Herminiimonas sp.]
MQVPLTPSDEIARLSALNRYDILDSPDEAEFDDLTKLASQICETPIALITFLDGSRQWFKSRVGVELNEAPRDISFCGHTILGDTIFEIGDASADERFFDNPLVTGDPNIRFYAGAPMITPDGYRLGTLCVLDRKPRVMSDNQRSALAALSRQAMRHLESRRAARELAEKTQFQEAVLNSTEIALISTGLDGIITSFNLGAQSMLGHTASNVVGIHMRALFLEPAKLAARLAQADSSESYAGQILASEGNGTGEAEDWLFVRADGASVPVLLAITPIRNRDGELVGVLHVARDVSRRRKAEAAEQKSIAILQKISTRVPGVICQFRQNADGSACFPYASRQLEQICRVRPEDALMDAEPVFRAVHPDDLQQLIESIRISALELTPWRHEYRVRFEDGVVRCLYGDALPERSDDGSTLWHGLITDITERNAADRELVRNQKFLETLINSLPVIIYSKSVQAESYGQFLTWNHAAEVISGFSAEYMIGKTDREIFVPELARPYEQHDRAIVSERAARTVPAHKVTRADGMTRTLRTTSVPLFASDGSVEYILGIAEDITEAMQNEQQIRRNQAELQAVSDASPLGLFRANLEGGYTYVNKTYEAITGLTQENALGEGWRQAVHAEDRERVTEAWSESMSSLDRFEQVHRFIREDGAEVIARVVAMPMMVDGVCTGFVGTVDDITSRRQVNNALLASEHRLRLLTDNLPALIGYIDADERYRFCNSGYQRILGKDGADMLGKTLEEVYGVEAYVRMGPEVHSALRGEHISFERTTMIGGMPAYFQCDYVPDICATGEVLGFYAMAIDVTSRRRAERQLAASERRMRTITDNIPAMVSHIDAEQRYIFVNAQVGALFQKDISAMIGKRMDEVHAPSTYACLHPHIDTVLRGETVTFEMDLMIDDVLHFFQVTYVPDWSEKRAVIGFYAMTIDVTVTKESAIRQAASERRLRTITDNLPVLISYIDNEQRVRFSNATMNGWLGISPEEAQDKHFEEVVGSEIYLARRPYLERALAGERIEYEMVTVAAGVSRHIQTIYVPDRDADGTVQGIYALSTDITRLKEIEARLLTLARFDTLTGLPNRYQLNQKLDEAVARSKRSPDNMAVLYLDIDHFKKINDTYGHPAGDAVLVEFGARLAMAVRQTDTVARLAGDEFIVVLEGLKVADEARHVAEKIVDVMREPFRLPDQVVQVGVSIGCAYSDTKNLTSSELLSLADKALYRAKNAGRNAVRDSVA